MLQQAFKLECHSSMVSSALACQVGGTDLTPSRGRNLSRFVRLWGRPSFIKWALGNFQYVWEFTEKKVVRVGTDHHGLIIL